MDTKSAAHCRFSVGVLPSKKDRRARRHCAGKELYNSGKSMANRFCGGLKTLFLGVLPALLVGGAGHGHVKLTFMSRLSNMA